MPAKSGDNRSGEEAGPTSHPNTGTGPVSFRSERSSTIAGDEIDDERFEELSKSLPTAVPMLEPEPAENAMLRPESARSRHVSRDDPGGERNVASAAPKQNGNGGGDGDDGPNENSPLLGQSNGAPAETEVDGEAPLFLNGTSPSRFWLIFVQILAAQFISCFDGTIMASSHPVITSYFHAANSASWLSTAFLLTSTATQPLLGRLSDAVGRKPLFIICLIILTLATAWCTLAQSIESFIAARAVCGVGAGGAMTLGSIIISDLVPIERRGSYQSYVNVNVGIGSAFGAALGGAIAEALGWRWEFGVQLPALVLCIIIAIFAIPSDIGCYGPRKSVGDIIREFDFKGSLLLTVATTFFILGLNLGGNVLPWSHPFVIVSLCISGVFFPTFVWVESRAALPIMPLRLINNSPRANLIYSNFIAAMLTNSILFNIPLYFQAVLLSSATSSGLRLILPSIVSSIAGALTGFAITWTRRLKWPVVTGALCYLAGCISLCLLRRNMSGVVYLLVLVPSSLGQGFQFPGTFMAMLASSEQKEQAVVTSTLILWRMIGMVLGVAVSSLVVQNSLVYYLRAYVEGDMRDDIITRVRSSVGAIAELEQPYREQVVQSYEAALRLTFIMSTVLAAISVLIIWPVKLPRLAAHKRKS